MEAHLVLTTGPSALLVVTSMNAHPAALCVLQTVFAAILLAVIVACAIKGLPVTVKRVGTLTSVQRTLTIVLLLTNASMLSVRFVVSASVLIVLVIQGIVN